MYLTELLMWWWRKFILVLSLLLLVGCGFRPMYDQTHQQEIQTALMKVDVAPIDYGRIGQDLRYQLIDKFGVKGRPRYQLKVDLKHQQRALTIEQDRVASRYNIEMTAHYVLKDLVSNKRIHKGVARATGSYDRVDSEFATFIAGSKSTQLVTRELAEKLTLHVTNQLLRL